MLQPHIDSYDAFNVLIKYPLYETCQFIMKLIVQKLRLYNIFPFPFSKLPINVLLALHF